MKKSTVFSFDLSSLNRLYKEWMQECQAHLPYLPTIRQAQTESALPSALNQNHLLADELTREEAG
jgi:hypothetical protein